MATVRKSAAGRPAYYYIEGNTARPLQTQPGPEVSRETQRNRERSLQMNFRYVLFLTVAAVLTVMVCVNYLKLQSAYTALQKNAMRMESQLDLLRLENDAQYNRIMSQVNLEDVKEKAVKRLGMVYAKAEQIEEYDAGSGDYVKQYRDVP